VLQVEKELSEICASILQLLDEHLIPTASTGESKVFYLKMKGDYHRYLAEFKTGADRKESAEHTLLAYKAAQVSGSAHRAPAVAAAAARVGMPRPRCALSGGCASTGRAGNRTAVDGCAAAGSDTARRLCRLLISLLP
jgi:hypothetical protein